MAFEELKEHADDIRDQAKDFIKSNIDYYRLIGFKMAMKSTTLMLRFILISMGLLLVLLFCSIAGAFAIGHYLNNYALGFLIVGGIYLVLTGLLYLNKDRIVEGPILKKFSEIFFNDKS